MVQQCGLILIVKSQEVLATYGFAYYFSVAHEVVDSNLNSVNFGLVPSSRQSLSLSSAFGALSALELIYADRALEA